MRRCFFIVENLFYGLCYKIIYRNLIYILTSGICNVMIPKNMIYIKCRKGEKMYFPLNPQLLELLLLSVISKKDTYGYQIGQDLKVISDLKDSTLYPILKRISDQGYVEIYDQQFNGRNRKYYHITEKGSSQLAMLKEEWREYTDTITELLSANEESGQDSKMQEKSVGEEENHD